ncbi:MAG: AtpZ/AtpI family protein [Thermoleophilaceae bacterium]|nr:AtpZ/AtpI family protein [Thermoleophilaceae bacterium]
MTETPRATPATAGFSLLAAIVLCAAIGFALGSLLGLAALLAVVGGFIGIGVGFAIVYRRFRDL